MLWTDHKNDYFRTVFLQLIFDKTISEETRYKHKLDRCIEEYKVISVFVLRIERYPIIKRKLDNGPVFIILRPIIIIFRYSFRV